MAVGGQRTRHGLLADKRSHCVVHPDMTDTVIEPDGCRLFRYITLFCTQGESYYLLQEGDKFCEAFRMSVPRKCFALWAVHVLYYITRNIF
jgi:hypothetical protein